jgi:plastocyanin
VRVIRRAAALLAASALAAAAQVSIGVAPATATTAHSVGISGYAFSPAVLTITAGDTVTWTNSDQAPHDVTTTSAPVAIRGSRMEKGQSWSYTFSTPGTYAYICSIHPDMKASVIVKAAPVTQPATPSATHSAPPRTRYRTVATAGGGMAMPAAHRSKRRPATAARTSTPPAPASTAPPPPVAVAAAPAASTTPERPLRPLLIVAGGVAALATLCLLLLAARAEEAEPPPR